MTLNKAYQDEWIPSWVEKGSREDAIDHIKYLTHRLNSERKAVARARARYIKDEKLLKKNGIEVPPYGSRIPAKNKK